MSGITPGNQNLSKRTLTWTVKRQIGSILHNIKHLLPKAPESPT